MIKAKPDRAWKKDDSVPMKASFYSGTKDYGAMEGIEGQVSFSKSHFGDHSLIQESDARSLFDFSISMDRVFFSNSVSFMKKW